MDLAGLTRRQMIRYTDSPTLSPMKPEFQDPSRQLLIDGYAVAGCAVLLLYLLSVLVF